MQERMFDARSWFFGSASAVLRREGRDQRRAIGPTETALKHAVKKRTNLHFISFKINIRKINYLAVSFFIRILLH